MHQFANYTTNTHCSKGFNPGTCCLLINFVIHGYFTHIIVMYYLYAERYENIHDKSLMENIFGIWSIQGSVQGRFCSICTTFDLSPISLGRSCFNKTFFSYLWLTVKQKKTDKLEKMGRSFIKADGQEGTIEKRQCALSTRCLRPSTTLLRLPIHNYINSG